MGAGKPNLTPTEPNPTKPILLAVVRVAAIVMALALPAVIYFAQQSEFPALAPREEAKLQKRLREIDDSEQYALIARVDGWYPCLHSGRPTYYLKKGEVWKYGVTSKGKFGRYNSDFFFDNRVNYSMEFKGNFAECLKQEQIKLFNYPYLPENLARLPADRLPRPPYNPIMR